MVPGVKFGTGIIRDDTSALWITFPNGREGEMAFKKFDMFIKKKLGTGFDAERDSQHSNLTINIVGKKNRETFDSWMREAAENVLIGAGSQTKGQHR